MNDSKQPSATNPTNSVRPWVTLGMLVILALCFAAQVLLSVSRPNPAWELTLGMTPQFSVLVDMGGLYLPALFEQNQWWRLLTATFLHGWNLHLLLNGAALYSLGRIGEQLWGPRFQVVVLLASALGATMLSAAVVESLMVLGASGAIFGLGVALIFELRSQSQSLPHLQRVQRSLSLQIGGWLVAGFVAAYGFDLPISAYGHAGGAVVGALVWLIARAPRWRWLSLGALLLWSGLLLQGWGAHWRPDHYRHLLGLHYLNEDKPQQAAEILGELVAQGAQDPVLLNEWAYSLLLSNGDPRTALEASQRALVALPEDPDVMDTVAWAHCQLGEVAEGKRLLERSLAIDPDDEEVRLHLEQCGHVAAPGMH